MAMISVTISGNAGPLKKAVGEADQSLGKIGDSFKKVGLAAAAGFGALAAGLGAAVKAAAEDQQSFEQLRTAIQNTTAATDEMVQAVDDQIAAMSMAFGVADDKLRPALANLVRATGDVTMSQEILNVALDISAATGRDLDAVSLALAKAYGGQTMSLTKLGIQLSDNAKNSGDFKDITDELTALFGGAAQANADTFSGKMARLQIVLSEAVETIGSYVLPIVTELADFFLKDLVPIFQRIIDRVGPAVGDAFRKIADIVRAVAIPVMDGLGTVFDKVREVIDRNSESINKIQKFFGDFIGFVRDRIAPIVMNVLGGAFKFIVENIFPRVFDGLIKFTGAMATVGSFVLKVIGAILGGFESMVNGIIDAVNFVIRQVNRLPDWMTGGNISEISGVSFSMPSLDTSATGSGFMGSPDRLEGAGASFNGGIPDLTIPETTGGGGGGGGRGGRGGLSIDPRALELGGLTLANLADYGNLESARLADLALLDTAQAPINITVNTVTADENLPTVIVDALQRYNLIYGPAEIEIAV
jgi:phage-related protein